MEEYIILSEDIPVQEYGVYPALRPVDEIINCGFVILDKWRGPTSRKVVDIIKHILKIKKAGHSGTLDPNVSGVLPILLGKACKVMPALQSLDKEYVGIMRLHKDVDEQVLLQAIKKYTGKIKQKPPVKSAVKRQERTRHVYKFEIIEKQKQLVLFRVACEKGTYIRTLCHQIGSEIGGSHLVELRRTRVGPFTESRAITMQKIAFSYSQWKEKNLENIRQYILPVEQAVQHLGKIIVKDSAVWNIANGSPLYSKGICRIQKDIKKNDMVAIFTLKGELIAIGSSLCNATKIQRIVAKPEKILLDKNTYPRIKKK